MTSIDQRVVQMNFDNKAFGKGVNQTVKDLSVLENKMQFKDAAKGFSQVEKAANGVKLSGIQTAIESVNNKFSAMGVVALTVLSNITTMAMNMGSKIAHALTLESVIAGYQEYETKLGSIQTILSNTQSKGGNITNVTAALDELNTYADKTIYNFGEMTRNIGTFTAAGVDLDTSVSAIKGIANLAAVSGSTSMQASTAMYQLSQALAAGTIRLMDWNSVVNAGMGGQVFQDALKETARAHGVSIDAIIEKQGSFRESLQDGWLSAEIMTDTLNKFTMTTSDYNKEILLSQGYTEEQAVEIMKLGDTATDAATKVKSFTQLIDTTKEALGSGWGKSWELIIGDMDEAKTLWTGASQVLGKMVDDSSDARNGMLMVWKSLGGRDAIITGLSNVFSDLFAILNSVQEAFVAVFPPITGEQLAEASKKVQELTERFKIGEGSLKTLGDAFKTFFSIIKNVASLVGGTLSAGFKILQPILAIIGRVLGYAVVAFGSFTSAIDSGTPALELLLGAINQVSDKIVVFIENISNGLPSLESFSAAIGRAKEVLSGLVSSTLGKASGGLSSLTKGFEKLSEWAQKAVSTVGDFVKNIDWNSVFLGGAAAGAAIGTGGIIAKIIGFLDGLKDAAENASGFVESLSGPLDSLKGVLEGYQQNLKAKTLINIAVAIGILAVSLLLLSQLDAGQLAGGVVALGAVMGELVGMVAILNKLNPASMTATSTSLLILSGALLIMASAMRVLANLSWDEIIRGTVALGALTGIMIGLTAAMNAIKSKAVGGAMSMIFIATALMVLAQALKMLGSIPFEVMVQGIGVMAASLLILTVVLNKMKSAVGGAVAMVIISGALIVLSKALVAFGSIPFNVLAQGIGVMTTSLLILSVVLNVMKSAIGGAVAMLIITAALLALSGVLVILGSIDTNVIAQGLLTMVGVLGLFAGVSLILAQFAPQVLIVSAAFVVFAVGLMIASAAVVVMATGLNMLLAAGLPALGMLALLAVALLPLIVISPLLLIAGAGMLALGAGLVVAGAGLLLFSMTSATAIPALFALAAAMVPLLAAAPMMAVVGAAMVVLGAGALLLGAGLIVLSMGFTMLNTSLPTGIEGLTRLAETAVQITPAAPLFVALGAALVVLGAGALVGGAGLIVLGAGLIVTSAGIALFSAAVSGPFQAATETFGKAMETFVWHTPGMLASGAALLVFGAGALLAGVSALMAGPGFLIMSAGLQRFMTVWPGAEKSFERFKVAVDAISPITDQLTSISGSMTALSASVMAFGTSIIMAASGTKAMSASVAGLATTLQSTISITSSASMMVSASMTSMVVSISNSVNLMSNQYMMLGRSTSTNMLVVISTLTLSSTQMVIVMRSLVSSISSAVNQIGAQFARIGPSISNGINSAIPIATQAGRNIVQGCLNGMGQLMSAVYNRGAEVGRKAVEGVNAGAGNASPSKKTTKSGINIDQGAINGMAHLLGRVAETGEVVGITAADSIEQGFKTLDQGSFSNAKFSPTVAPVMDLSQVQNASNLRRMMSNDGVGISVDSKYVNGSVENLSQTLYENQSNILESNRQIIQAIDTLKTELGELVNGELPPINLYMNDRLMASTLARPMNVELRTLQRRGVL